MVADDVPDGSTGSGLLERVADVSSPARSETPRYRPESAVDDGDVVGLDEVGMLDADEDVGGVDVDGVDVGGVDVDDVDGVTVLEDEDIELGVSELLRATTDEYDVLDSVVGRARTEPGAGDVDGVVTGGDDEADGRDGSRAGGRDDCEETRDDGTGARADGADARVDCVGGGRDDVAAGAANGSSSSSARGSRLGRRSDDPKGRSTAIPAGLSFL